MVEGSNIHTHKKEKKNSKEFTVFVHCALKLQALSVIEKLGENGHKYSKERLYNHWRKKEVNLQSLGNKFKRKTDIYRNWKHAINKPRKNRINAIKTEGYSK